jgi:mannose-6-phosphate isomerase-like protein (cupin superfamily)
MTAIDPSDCPITATASMEPATPGNKTQQKQPPIVERHRRRGHSRARTFTARCTGVLYATGDEWNYIISGQGRLTVFVAPEASQTYNFRAGDVGHIPSTNAHYLENTSWG